MERFYYAPRINLKSKILLSRIERKIITDGRIFFGNTITLFFSRHFHIILSKLSNHESRVKFATPSCYATTFSNLIVYRGNEVSSSWGWSKSSETNDSLPEEETRCKFVRARIYYPTNFAGNELMKNGELN